MRPAGASGVGGGGAGGGGGAPRRGEAEGLETEQVPELLGVVARAQLSVRLIVPKVMGILGYTRLQPHSGPGPNKRAVSASRPPLLEGWCFFLWVPTSPHASDASFLCSSIY